MAFPFPARNCPWRRSFVQANDLLAARPLADSRSRNLGTGAVVDGKS